jgi:transmembrane sensor
MTSATPDDDARCADDEAVEWVILLRDEPDNDDVRIRFEAWLAASPINAKAWAATAHAYDRAGDARPAFARPVRMAEERPVLPPGPAPYTRRRGKSRSTSKQFMARRAWVAVSIAACLALIFAPSLTLRARADYLTGTAETTEAKLPDGTLARLAPASAIAVTYAGNRREVRLLKGEAWFDVRHDLSRPFYVDANGVTTTDIGTAFDVHLDSKGVTTEVAQGRVRVAYDGAPPISELLSGGDSVRVAFDGSVSHTIRPADQVAAWRNRQIIVRDRPASDVIDALRPWFAGIIVVQGHGFSDHRVTGVYNTADPVEALRGLTQAYGGSVTTVTPWVILLSAGPTGSSGAPE